MQAGYILLLPVSLKRTKLGLKLDRTDVLLSIVARLKRTKLGLKFF